MKKTPKLGQHFLTGTWAAAKLAECIDVRAGERILEIGPGTGALTKELLRTGAPVVAIEKDEALVETLKHSFAPEIEDGSLTLIEGDVRDLDPARAFHRGTYVLEANIPYYITGEIIRSFLEADHQPRAMALLIQKEVADRIIARDGKESILSLSVKAYGTPRIVAKVSRGNFSPPPKVDSAIICIDAISKAFFADVSEPHFFAVVRAGFSSKRKQLANTLGAVFGKEASLSALGELGLDATVRAEDLPIRTWKQLAQRLTSQASGSTS